MHSPELKTVLYSSTLAFTNKVSEQLILRSKFHAKITENNTKVNFREQFSDFDTQVRGKNTRFPHYKLSDKSHYRVCIQEYINILDFVTTR